MLIFKGLYFIHDTGSLYSYEAKVLRVLLKGCKTREIPISEKRTKS